jgi:hypothetical protein
MVRVRCGIVGARGTVRLLYYTMGPADRPLRRSLSVTVPVGPSDSPRDLAAATFAALTEEFFELDDVPVPFSLRDKRNTQDDPLDELVKEVLDRRLPKDIRVISSGKPLVSPDIVVARPEETQLLIAGGTELDSRRLIAIEVKKVNADASGRAARGTGLDYNTTPPCRMVKIVAANRNLLRVPAYYLFVVLLPAGEQQIMQTMALVAGEALNQDLVLYDEATGVREKRIGLGTFGDGLDRQRPMFVFANPLGWDWLTGHATLVHSRDDLASEQPIVRIRELHRTATDGSAHVFWCYRMDNGRRTVEAKVVDPFPTPKTRTTATTPRGMFEIDL